jgi:hypothetical protein
VNEVHLPSFARFSEGQIASRIAHDKSAPSNISHWAAGTYAPFAELMSTPDIVVALSTKRSPLPPVGLRTEKPPGRIENWGYRV